MKNETQDQNEHQSNIFGMGCGVKFDCIYIHQFKFLRNWQFLKLNKPFFRAKKINIKNLKGMYVFGDNKVFKTYFNPKSLYDLM